jgi:DNA-directed RNA polymerase specialized sigma24 family protein
VAVIQPRLQRALVAAYGSERGREATAEALGYAWEHWRKVRRMEHPLSYLYRVGQSRTRPRKRPPTLMWDLRVDDGSAGFEPGLPAALASLSEAQRVAVVLVHGYGWTLREVAELTAVTVSTVQSHAERALTRLRMALEVTDGA